MRRRTLIGAGAGAAAGGWIGRPRAAPAVDLQRLHTGDLGALVAVPATLADQPWRCLVDSGASVALVSPAVAERAQLRVIDSRRVATAGGVMRMDRVALPAVRVGGEPLDVSQALVLDLARHLGDAGAAVDGLIGAAALRDRVVRFDLAAGRLDWRARADPMPAAGHAVWPLRWDQGLPVIDLSIGGRDPAPFLFDTGQPGALVVFAHHAERLAAGSAGLPSITLRELGGEVTVHHALLARLEAPGYLALDVPVAFEAGATARRGAHFDRLAGSAGLALFDAGAVTLDGPNGRLIVEQSGLPQAAPLPGGFGFVLQSRAGEAPVVAAVLDDGPAAAAGVRPGARLRRIDDRPLVGHRAGEVWAALAGTNRARFDFDTLPAPASLARERFFPRWR